VARRALWPQIGLVAKERAIWSGALSFGLVNIPVRLFSATKSHDIGFHQYEEKTGRRIHNKRVAEGGNREIPYEHIVKGYEVSKGRVVFIEPEELEVLAPKKTQTIDIEEFVDLHEIDPIYWETTYFLAPDERAGAPKSYALLRQAMEETKRVGIGRFVMRTKEYLATIRPFADGLALETMYFADEVRSQSDVLPAAAKKASAPAQQVALAKQLIKSLEAHFDPKRYKDTYRDQVLELIRKKGRGEEIEAPAAAEPAAEVVDLMEALKASLGGNKPARPTRRRKRAA
jgi:DNA end-binding protein Ku